MALVPLVVVITRVLPEQTDGTQPAGELPRSNPSIGRPLRSPARTAEPGGLARAAALASSISTKGTIATQPAARAWIMVVVARSTSITTATPPRIAPGGIKEGRRWTQTGFRLGIWGGPRAIPSFRIRIEPEEDYGMPGGALGSPLRGEPGAKLSASRPGAFAVGYRSPSELTTSPGRTFAPGGS